MSKVAIADRSWDAMREAEYGGAAFMVPPRQRPELVQRMRATGLTQQEIADTAGVSERRIRDDLAEASTGETPIEAPPTITNSRGQTRPATYARRVAEPEPTAVHMPSTTFPCDLRHAV